MRNRLAAIGLVLAGVGAPAGAGEPSAGTVALNNVPAVLDGAENALGACPQAEIAARARAAILDARAYLAAATTNPGAMVALNAKMEAIREALQTCLRLKNIADSYHAKCQGDVRLGMTTDQVRRTAWCEPTKIVTTETTGRRREEWIYASDRHMTWIGRPTGRLSFSDGKLTSIRRGTP